MGSGHSENRWTWPGIAWCLWPLAPNLAPSDLVSNANVRMSALTPTPESRLQPTTSPAQPDSPRRRPCRDHADGTDALLGRSAGPDRQYEHCRVSRGRVSRPGRLAGVADGEVGADTSGHRLTLHSMRSTYREMQRGEPPPLLPLLRSRLQADLLTLVLLNPGKEWTLSELPRASSPRSHQPSVRSRVRKGQASSPPGESGTLAWLPLRRRP